MFDRFLARSCFLMLVAGVAGGSARAASGAAEPQAGWKAGTCSVVITPERPMLMCGSVSPKPSTGKIHDLYAKALALEDRRGTRLVIVAIDVAMIPGSMRDWLEREVRRRFGLPPQGLLLNASHTHSGPETRVARAVLYGFPPQQVERIRQYVDRLQAKLLEAVDGAIGNMAAARLAYTHARAGFAMNRRLKTDRGYVMGPNPDGPVDHDVPVLKVQSPGGQLQAVVFGYACHAVAVKSHKFCGDYPGFAQRYVEQAHPGATALFLTGCAGDQRPYPTGSLVLAEQYGRELANAVEAALIAQPRPVRGPLRLALEEVALEFDKPPSREQLKQQANSAKGIQRRRAEILLKELEQTGSLRTTWPYLVHVAQFGSDLTLAALGWEVVVDYSLRLKAELAGPPVWVAAYSNEVYNYVPSLRVLKEGGYEAGGSLLGYTTAPARFAPSVEELIVGKVHELVKKARTPASQ